jgi:hypothetical protein
MTTTLSLREIAHQRCYNKHIGRATLQLYHALLRAPRCAPAALPWSPGGHLQ